MLVKSYKNQELRRKLAGHDSEREAEKLTVCTNRTLFYPAWSEREACFEQVCTIEDYRRAIKNEEKGC